MALFNGQVNNTIGGAHENPRLHPQIWKYMLNRASVVTCDVHSRGVITKSHSEEQGRRHSVSKA